jgi:hypothetical protein
MVPPYSCYLKNVATYISKERQIINKLSNGLLVPKLPLGNPLGSKALLCKTYFTRIIRHAAKNLVARAFQPVPKKSCFSLVSILPVYFKQLANILKSS